MLKKTPILKLKLWLHHFFLEKKHTPFQSISQLLLGIFIFCLPFQIRTLIYTGSFYVNGNFSAFNTFFIYANDLLLIGSFIAWTISVIRKEQLKKLLYGDTGLTLIILIILGILTLNTFWADEKVLHILNLFRFFEFFLLYLLMVNDVLKARTLLLIFMSTMSFQAITAIFQYILQHSMGLRFLGEPIATAQTLGVAKIEILGNKILRAFGTFPHANVLGGALGLSIITIFWIFPKNWWIRSPFLFLLGLGLTFTFSRSALFAIATSFFIYFAVNGKKVAWRPILLTLSIGLFLIISFHLENIIIQRLFFEDQASTNERILYMDMSQKMIRQEPLGVGLGAFTNHMQTYTDLKLAPWLYQPVHNIFLLMANEAGIVAGIMFIGIFIYLFYKIAPMTSKKKVPSLYLCFLTYIVTVGLFDHYFISLYSGQVMFFIILGCMSQYIQQFRKEEKPSVLVKKPQ